MSRSNDGEIEQQWRRERHKFESKGSKCLHIQQTENPNLSSLTDITHAFFSEFLILATIISTPCILYIYLHIDPSNKSSTNMRQSPSVHVPVLIRFRDAQKGRHEEKHRGARQQDNAKQMKSETKEGGEKERWEGHT